VAEFRVCVLVAVPTLWQVVRAPILHPHLGVGAGDGNAGPARAIPHIRDAGGPVRLDHPSGQATKPVLAVQRRSRLYCARCGGNALFEPALDAASPPQRPTVRREFQAAS